MSLLEAICQSPLSSDQFEPMLEESARLKLSEACTHRKLRNPARAFMKSLLVASTPLNDKMPERLKLVCLRSKPAKLSEALINIEGARMSAPAKLSEPATAWLKVVGPAAPDSTRI